jgi:hypothetical protein
VAWVRKKTGPPVEIIKSVSDAEKLLHVDTPLAIAYVEFLEVMHDVNWIYFRVFFFQDFRNTDYEAFAP